MKMLEKLLYLHKLIDYNKNKETERVGNVRPALSYLIKGRMNKWLNIVRSQL